MFEVICQSKKSRARIGVLHTAHGAIETPVFMPVGTQATVKGVTTDQLNSICTQIILGNVYHLNLRPTSERIAAFGGLHRFMHWDKPILTDSGGYQVFSLQNQRTIDAQGVTFKSHVDGSLHRLTPKRVIDIQRNLGSDIMMPLDICTPYPSTQEAVEADMDITHRWETEAFHYWQEQLNGQLLFGLVQGGMFKESRQRSAEYLTQHDFSGFSIGGLSVGEPKDILEDMTSFVTDYLPENKPRYLMGVGLPENFEPAILAGIDMFDCVAPTRLARHGNFFTHNGRKNIRNACFSDDTGPLDAQCECTVCRHYSCGYVRHLSVVNEALGATLLSLHNIAYVFQLVDRMKQGIRSGII
jgi:queuine tRNA-ribosyltransferase